MCSGNNFKMLIKGGLPESFETSFFSNLHFEKFESILYLS